MGNSYMPAVRDNVQKNRQEDLPKVRATKTTAIPTDSYMFVLRINDTSMVPGLGHSHIDIFYNLTRSTGSKAVLQPYTIETATAYPTQVEVFRGAALYARVAQPSWIVDQNSTSALNEPKYRLIWSSPQMSPFRVTNQGGIVYVSDTSRLQQGPSNVILKLEVRFPEDEVKNVTLGITVLDSDVDGPCNSTSHWFSTSEKHWDHCAESTNYKSCVSMCAVGTGSSSSQSVFRRLGNGCLWRGARKPSNNFTTNYSTCTPDIATCPDFVCDPLEKLYKLICPQDCSTDVFFRTGHEKRGLLGGRGICTCDENAKCACLSNIISNTSSATTTSPPIQHPVTGAQAEKTLSSIPGMCGTECVLGITSLFLFMISTFAIFLCCNKRLNKNFLTKHCLRRVLSLPEIPMENVEGTVNPEDGEANGMEQQNTDASRALISASTVSTIKERTGPLDDKWEFSRNHLFFSDGKIGEGEFGVVLKAQALDLKGFPGLMTVAVKTVKQRSNPQELQDLISEFELLKEVSHPNVIRLLGACTLPTNEPIYLIIEFAEYGSLRSYLRKVRNLGSEDPMPCPSTSTQPMLSNQEVTPRDILSFAWQISRGMAYLSEIKLVHRDLAARNILLATGRVCKISDFGLTRDVYIDDAYRKKSNGRVPVKWMALECLADHIYTTKSDVWSFGILLWELVTLGATPYPGVEVHNLYNLLCGGYRMEKPFSCSDELYTVMSHCWKADPNERPSFKEIEECLDQMLADGVDYLDIRQMTFDNKLYFDDEDEPVDDKKDDVAQYSNDDHTSASTAPLLETKMGKSNAHLRNLLPEDEQSLFGDHPSSSSSSSEEESHSYKAEDNLNLEGAEDGYLSPKPATAVCYMSMNGKKNKKEKFLTVIDPSKKFESQKLTNNSIAADNIINDK